MDPLPAVSGREEVAETAAHALESFYPVSPTIDLHKTQEYRENVNCTGQVILWPLWPFLHFIKGSFTLSFTSSHPIRFQGRLPLPPCTHSLLPGWSWHQIQAQPGTVSSQNADVHLWERLGSCTHSVRGKKVDAPQRPVAFSCAVRAENILLHRVCVCVFQTQPQSVLDCPITVQAVGTNGRIFQFLVFQLNTTDLTGDHGVKNQVSAQCPEQNRTAPSCGWTFKNLKHFPDSSRCGWKATSCSTTLLKFDPGSRRSKWWWDTDFRL